MPSRRTISLIPYLYGYLLDSRPPNKPRCFRLRSAKCFIISTVLLGIYVDIFLYGGTVVVIPFVLEDQLGLEHSDLLAWTSYSLIAYSVAAVISSPLAGFLADKAKSRREPLLVGLGFLLSGTICLWVASNGHVLLLGRVLQGISCGFVWSIGLALIVDTVGRDEIGKVLGLADIALCLSIATSPPISGGVLKSSGKNAVYGLALGLIIMDVAMRILLIEPKDAMAWVISASDEESSCSTTSTEEIKDENEVPYWKVLTKSYRIWGALLGTWAVAHILSISIDATVPLHCEERFGWGSWEVGLFLLAFYGPSILCVYTGHLADKHGGKWPAIGGFLGCAPSFLGLSFASLLPKEASKTMMVILMIFAGVALSFANTPVMAEVIYAVIDKQAKYPSLRRNSGGYGLAYGMFMTVFSIGSVTASTISPIIFKTWGWNGLMLSLSLCSILGAIPVACWTGNKGQDGRYSTPKFILKLTRKAGDAQKALTSKLQRRN